MKKLIKQILILPFVFAGAACTNLDENMYDIIGTNNLIQNKEDIVSLAMMPYSHAFYTLRVLPDVQENAGDQWATYARHGNLWLGDGEMVRLHRHEWNWDDNYLASAWKQPWAGIAHTNNVEDILADIDPAKYNMERSEYTNLRLGNRCLRAWFYIHVLDLFRNVPIFKSLKHTDQNTASQVSPQATFDFIEGELLEVLNDPDFYVKASLGGNQARQQQWNKAGAAALLVRLYLNSEKWTGVARYDKCAEYAQKIIDGEYGLYKLDDSWDKPFKWNNDQSDELIFAFESSLQYKHEHYSMDVYYWALCINVNSRYFLSDVDGDPNFRFALTPGLDNDGNEFTSKLGKPIRKFKKYPSDYRLKLYKNLSGGEREGMFLFGKIPDLVNSTPDKTVYLPQLYTNDPMIIRDQSGFFYDTPEEQLSIDDKRSGVAYADDGSGWRLVKYPFYGASDHDKIYQADYAEIRLAEIYYSLAECRLRAGNAKAAGDLLNEVRKRNYPESDYAGVLYQGSRQPMGSIVLDMDEMLDEWGREFIGEMRRRTDIIRFDRFGEAWWDKPATDKTKEIFPLHRSVLATHPEYKQNEGYEHY